MNNITDIPIALIAGPRSGSGSIINYFVEVHGYNFEYCDVPVNKPKTIYLLRNVAKFNHINSHDYQKMEEWIEKFVKLANNDEIHTIALIRHPIQQLLSIYHKIIENGGNYNELKFPVSTNLDKFITCMRYNGIIHKSVRYCKSIIDIENLCSTTTGLNFRLMNIKESSGNRGIEFFKRHNLISPESIERINSSESFEIYSNLLQQQFAEPLQPILS